ncbi:FecR family protein [Ensifer sp.]|uniref:FecR family protein n=1 Tax=Ensifer sp. TaxID=1872086 RepID=UPI00289793BA|nr:FecR family protein [Ensifer sp.]
MKSVGNDDSDKTPAVLEEAAEWLLQLRETPQDADLCRRFEAWRSQSPEHRAAWDRTQAMWDALGEAPAEYGRLSPARGENTVPRSPTHRRHAHARRAWAGRLGRPRLAGAAAAAALCAALFFGPAVMLRLQADQLTATAEIRTVKLEDGSTVVLGADSAIKSAIGDGGRKITLLAGEAFFDVVADGRPFVVEAGGVEVEVLGTAFDVRMTSAATDVALAHGSVRTRFRDDMSSQATLAPGEVISIERDSGAETRGAIAVSDIATWREGRLYVTNQTIGSVVELIQRYHPAWITVPDRGLAAKRVSGIYDLTRPDQALRALVGPYGGTVRSASPLLRVITRL